MKLKDIIDELEYEMSILNGNDFTERQSILFDELRRIEVKIIICPNCGSKYICDFDPFPYQGFRFECQECGHFFNEGDINEI